MLPETALMPEVQELTTRKVSQGQPFASIPTNAIIPVEDVDGGVLGYVSVSKLFSNELGVSVSYETVAELEADLDHDVNTLAMVWGEPFAELSGYYVKLGLSGAGSWQLTTLGRGRPGDPGGNAESVGTFNQAKLLNLNATGGIDQIFLTDRGGPWKRVAVAPNVSGENIQWFKDLNNTIWQQDFISPMPAYRLGVVPGDVSLAQAAANTYAMDRYFTLAGASAKIFLDRGKTQFTNLVLSFGHLIIGHDSQFTTSEFQCVAEAGVAIKLTNRSAGLKDLQLTSSAGRLANGGPQDHGVLATPGDVPVPASMSRLFFDHVVVRNQPGDGVYTIGQVQYSKFGYLECIANKGAGLRHDAGEAAGYANAVAPTGLFESKFYNGFDNGGPGLVIGAIDQDPSVLGYRITIEQMELVDNAHDPERCPEFPAADLPDNPIQTFAGSNIATVTMPAHPFHKGHYARFAGLEAVGGLVGAQLNRPLIVVDWISDTQFRVVLPTVASAAATGGGTEATVSHIVRSQFFISGSTVNIKNSAAGNTNYNSATSLHGNPKNINSFPSGGGFLYDVDACEVSNFRAVNLSFGIMADSAGVPEGNVPTSKSQNITLLQPKMLSDVAAKAQFGYIFPRGCRQSEIINMFSIGATAFNATGSVAAVYNRTRDLTYRYEGKQYISLPDYAYGDWCLNDTPVEYTVSAGSTLTVLHSKVKLVGAGDVADFFRSVLTKSNTGDVILPDGYEVTLINSKAYNQSLDDTGNLVFSSGTSLTLGTNKAARFVSNGTKLCQI